MNPAPGICALSTPVAPRLRRGLDSGSLMCCDAHRLGGLLV